MNLILILPNCLVYIFLSILYCIPKYSPYLILIVQLLWLHAVDWSLWLRYKFGLIFFFLNLMLLINTSVTSYDALVFKISDTNSTQNLGNKSTEASVKVKQV